MAKVSQQITYLIAEAQLYFSEGFRVQDPVDLT